MESLEEIFISREEDVNIICDSDPTYQETVMEGPKKEQYTLNISKELGATQSKIAPLTINVGKLKCREVPIGGPGGESAYLEAVLPLERT